MKLWVKAAVTGICAVSAGLSAMWALNSIKVAAQDAPAVEYEWSCDETDAQYVLREYSGYVGIFDPGTSRAPVTVTDIETDSLREADRNMLDAGIAVSDRDELLSLLEDLGS